MNKKERFFLVVIVVRPKPEVPQQFCPRLCLVYLSNLCLYEGLETLICLHFLNLVLFIVDTQ